MVKKLLYIIPFFFCFLTFNMNAQESKAPVKNQEAYIEGLSFYPNPVSNGKIYITSKLALEKEITIFDVLGKRVYQSVLSGKELNIGSLSPGVYIIKIKEGEASATRKLIIK